MIDEFYSYCWELVTVWSEDRLVVTGVIGFLWFVGTMLSIIDHDKPVTRATWSATIFALLFVCYPILISAVLVMVVTWWVGKLREENA